jgi:hypothetical protein
MSRGIGLVRGEIGHNLIEFGDEFSFISIRGRLLYRLNAIANLRYFYPCRRMSSWGGKVF